MDAIDSYWSDGFPHIQGWVSSGHLQPLKLVDEIQRSVGIKGHVAEIGVFHGKFLLALASLLNPGDKVTALDVFDDQDKNLDGAGEGNLGILQQNVAAYGRQDLDYSYVQADSSALTMLDKVELTRSRGPFRLFSVDGCHTTEHTLADLRTAQDCMAPGGVIILDDYMQPHWPGVTEAVSLFCTGAPRMVPFLYTLHKLYFVGIGWHAHFLAASMQAFAGHDNARTPAMFGRNVMTLYP